MFVTKPIKQSSVKMEKANIFKELKMKMKDGVVAGSEPNIGICERVKLPLRKRNLSLCYTEEPDEKRERRGRSEPIEPIVLHIKKTLLFVG